MTFFHKQISTIATRKKVLVTVATIISFIAFEAAVYLSGIYQLRIFLRVAIIFYLGFLAFVSFVFDLNLKPEKLERKKLSGKFAYILTALKKRFHYLFSWPHWRHFQNYLMMPGVLYWSIMALIFLNPFSGTIKHSFAVLGAFLMGIMIWYLKMIFIRYDESSMELRYLMFTATIFTSFLAFAGALGATWYFGISGYWFMAASAATALQLMHQALFHRHLALPANFKFTATGTVILAVSSATVFSFWSVNYYSAGLLLAGVFFLYLSLTIQYLQRRLTGRMALEYILFFIFRMIFVLSTTNFSARIS